MTIMQVKPACEVSLPILATSRTLNISRMVVPLFPIVTSTSSLFVTTAYLDSAEKRRTLRTDCEHWEIWKVNVIGAGQKERASYQVAEKLAEKSILKSTSFKVQTLSFVSNGVVDA
jgi:hypothetical protein